MGSCALAFVKLEFLESFHVHVRPGVSCLGFEPAFGYVFEGRLLRLWACSQLFEDRAQRQAVGGSAEARDIAPLTERSVLRNGRTYVYLVDVDEENTK